MSNLSTLPKGDSAWLLRKAIERIIQQVSVLETNIGASTSGNSANTQIIFNDNGTLRGDAGLVYNKTTDALTVAGLVTAGSATITGDLTVDTSTLKVDSTNNRVGIGTASPGKRCEINQSANAITTIGAGEILRLIGDDGNVVSRITEVGFGSGPTGATYAPVVIGAVNTSISGFGTKDFYVATRAGISDVAPLERYRIDSTGVSTWSVAGTTAMTLNSTGLGIGVSPTYKLDVSSSSNIVGRVSSSNVFNTGFNITNTTASTWSLYSFGSNDATLQNSFGIYHQNGTSFLQITQSGNVGIGVTPSAWATLAPALQIGSAGAFFASQGSTEGVYIGSNAAYYGGAFNYVVNGSASYYRQQGGVHSWFYASSGIANNALSGTTQAMTLDASGNLLVGKTSSGNNIAGVNIYKDTNDGGRVYMTRQSGALSQTHVAFFESGGSPVGSISTTNVATSYNISSDYRLKQSVQPLAGGLARVNALKPSTYKWNLDGSAGEGFIAHELAEVVPFAVSGQKDAVNEDGSIKIQGVDLSKIVPILVAAIQELTAEVNALKNA